MEADFLNAFGKHYIFAAGAAGAVLVMSQVLVDLEQQVLVDFFFLPLSGLLAKLTPATSMAAVANKKTFFMCL